MKKDRFDFFTRMFFEVQRFIPFASEEVGRFITAMSCLETNFGTSRVCRVDNNYFGMDYPKLRFTVAERNDGRFAVYSSWSASVVDFSYWLTWNRFSQSDLKDLSLFLSKFENSGFNPSLNYVNSVKKIVLQYEQN